MGLHGTPSFSRGGGTTYREGGGGGGGEVHVHRNTGTGLNNLAFIRRRSGVGRHWVYKGGGGGGHGPPCPPSPPGGAHGLNMEHVHTN